MQKVNADELEELTWSSPIGKWGVPIPERRLLRSDALAYYDAEE